MSEENNKDYHESGSVIWITGLSGAGKTTLAEKVASELRNDGWPVVLLDGDVLREAMDIETLHNSDERLAVANKYAKICQMLASQGLVVVIATISLFSEIHTWNRKNLPKYIEIFLKVPMFELIRRDPKGIYKKFQNGKVKNVSGLDLKVDEPLYPDWVEVFDPLKSQSSNAEELLAYLKERLKNEN